jgi:D-alanyl-D-alanine carboxypeptidase
MSLSTLTKITRYPLWVLATALWSLAALATEQPMPIPAPPTVSAQSYILQDYHTGRVLAESNADQRAEPASITKLMTAYVVFKELASGNLKLDNEITISEQAWRTGGSRTFVQVGTKVKVEDLLKGMIIQSGNDASVALAEHVAGSEEAFATLMNRYAENVGLTNTQYVNSTGLPDPEHYTTARDIARLAAVIIREFPVYYRWYSEKEFTYNNITQYNRNSLLRNDPSVDGMKTGYTAQAQYCLVTSAKRDDMRLISVLLGSRSAGSRAAETRALINYGFRFFETWRLYAAGEPLTQVRIWKGENNLVPLGLVEDLYVTIPRKHYNQLKGSLDVQGLIVAPAKQGQAFGMVHIALGDTEVIRQPLVALHNVAPGNLWKQTMDQVLLIFQR